MIVKKIINWLLSKKIVSSHKRAIETIVAQFIYFAGNGVIVWYNDPIRSKVLDLVKQIKKETEMLLEDIEGYNIWMAVKRTEKINGDIAEVGVYKGGSAKIICEAKKGNKQLYLFDTFEGLPDVEKIDISFTKGQLVASIDDVKNYLKKYSNIHFYKGFFPKTGEPIKNRKFSFVHLDVDIYSSTLSGLNFFYPRLNRGGVIISHDYIQAAGVRKAFDDFFKDKPEPIIELPRTQCLIVKI